MNTKSKVFVIAMLGLSAVIFSPNLVHAEQDFSKFSNEELMQMRNQVQNMNQEDRARFQHELQLRTQNMNAAEREQQGVGSYGQEDKIRERLYEDNTQGQGSLERKRERYENNTGYGKGFDSRHGAVGGGGRGR